jgi:ATP-dependent DNA helicase RecQ
MPSDSETKQLSILKNIFGYDSFRPLHQNIIETVLEKMDCLVVMPTGGGKSICYQIPALIFEGLTVVVSPLISLMQDQVDQMNQLGIAAVLLNSAISREQYETGIHLIRENKAPPSLCCPRDTHEK